MFSTDFKRGWLRGFFDGEGGAYWYDNPPEVRTSRRRGTHHSHKVEAANTDWTLIQNATDFLTDLGIGYRLRVVQKASPKSLKPCWRLEIQKGPDIIRFAELVGFTPGSKADTLSRIVHYVSTSNTYLHQRVDVESMLRMYDSGMSYRQIAAVVGYRSGDSVRGILSKRPEHKPRSHRNAAIQMRKRHRHSAATSEPACHT